MGADTVEPKSGRGESEVNRSAALARSLEAARGILAARTPRGSPSANAAARRRTHLQCAWKSGRRPRAGRGRTTAGAPLSRTCARTRPGGASAGAPAEAFAALEPELGWIRRAGSAAYGPVFHDGHANAIIVAPEGLERRGDVPIGVSVVAPNVRYVDHRHPPEEVHLVMK